MDIFCKIIEGSIPSNICYQTEDVIVIMDANPNSPGHALVIPKKHYTSFLDMDNEIMSKINEVAKLMIQKMEERFAGIKGVKITVNYGEPQVVKHYHMHLIPIYEVKPTLTQEEMADILKD